MQKTKRTAPRMMLYPDTEAHPADNYEKPIPILSNSKATLEIQFTSNLVYYIMTTRYMCSWLG
jgi:hypothetical protein